MQPLIAALEILGCAVIIFAFSFIAAVLVLSIERAAPQASPATTSSPVGASETAAPALSHVAKEQQ